MRKNRNSVFLVDLATVGAATLGVVFLPHPKTTPYYQPSVTGGIYGGFDLFGTQVVLFARSPSSFPLCGLGSDFRSSVLPDLGENPSLATVFLDFPFVTQTSHRRTVVPRNCNSFMTVFDFRLGKHSLAPSISQTGLTVLENCLWFKQVKSSACRTKVVEN